VSQPGTEVANLPDSTRFTVEEDSMGCFNKPSNESPTHISMDQTSNGIGIPSNQGAKSQHCIFDSDASSMEACASPRIV
jgi:hypothetical protein